MGRCCALKCRNRASRGIRLFKLPKSPRRRKLWLSGIRRGAGWKPPDRTYLCEDHFEPSQFQTRCSDGWRRLKATAVPSLFLHSESQMSRKIKQLENENHRLVRQAALQKTREATFRSHLHEFFTVDQLAALSRSSNRGSKWSNETVKKSLQMRSACGSLGYDLLLEGSFPLPSSRTLGRRLEGEHCPTGPQSLHGHCPALPGGESWLEHQLPHHGLVLGTEARDPCPLHGHRLQLLGLSHFISL
ncbi:uncharacterized protein ISCGN_012003 [Ixodes scapularis]